MFRTGLVVFFFFFVAAAFNHVFAQETVNVRGIIIDKATNEPLFGASISLEGQDGKIIGATADAQGLFVFEKVPVGSYSVSSTFVGYNKFSKGTVRVSAENSTLTIELEPSTTQLTEVVVAESKTKGDNDPINNMAVISARSFNVEQSERIAASLGDPSRLALSFAGVRGQSDILNGIVVRGNAPKGVLWRVEGVEVPSPNHFSQEGYGAGAVCILSGQVIGTSDFYSGAFPAEYGNALSAVFDIKLRKGDTERRRYFMQLGMMGLEAGMEGPFVNNKKSSYLVNYRYSTLAILEKIGMDIGNTITAYQDLTVKLNFPTKRAGTFSVFGIGGKSTISITEDNRRGTRREEKVKTYEMGVYGVQHAYQINANNLLKTTLMFTANRESLIKDEYSYRTQTTVPEYRQRGSNIYFRNVVQLDSKLSERSSLRSGIITTNMRFVINDTYDIGGQWQGDYTADGYTYTLEAFSQLKYALSRQWTLHTGMHVLYFGLNDNFSIEPRVALAYQINRKHALGWAAGLHSRLEALANYMVYDPWKGSRPNEGLDFTKAAHTGLSYEYTPIRHLKLKTELYFQYLYDVPISTDEGSYFSMLNFQDRYITMVLANGGKGINYGAEFTIEKAFAKNYYILTNASIFSSRFYAADGIWRNTRYGGKFVVNFTAGKDFLFGKNKQWTFGLNGRTMWAGGEKTFESEYSDNIKNYFRVDTRVSIARQRPHVKWIFAIDVQNATNRINETTLEEIESTGILPVVSFRVELK